MCPSAVPAEQAQTVLLAQTMGTPGVDFPAGLFDNTTLMSAAPGHLILTRSHYVAMGGDWLEPRFQGVFYYNRKVAVARVSDGTSNTLMFGECGGMTIASQVDLLVVASVGTGPLHSRLGVDQGTGAQRYTLVQGQFNGEGPIQFSSRHPAGLNFAFCDGSVRTLGDPARWNASNFPLFLRMGGYADGESVTPE